MILRWKVIKGDGKWKVIGYPTANIKLELPCISINAWSCKSLNFTYKVNVIIDSKKHIWVWTYMKNKWVFEVHILDFDKDIYNKYLELFLIHKIRHNKKFKSDDILAKQIAKDISKAIEIEKKVITFWTFDKFHPWHQYYLWEASKYWDKLITMVARDKTVKKVKWKKPADDESRRLLNVKKHWLSDIVDLWHECDYFHCISTYKPDIICLWYDQSAFVWMLESFLRSNNINAQIVRIWSHKPETYKSSKL